VPALGSLAKVDMIAQFAPLVGRAAGQSDCAQSKVVQSQVFASEHVQELQASAAKSLGAHGDSLAAPPLPVEPAAPDEPAIPGEPAVPAEPAELVVPALPALPASFIAPMVALLPAHADAMQLDAAPNPSHHSFVARLILLFPFVSTADPVKVEDRAGDHDHELNR
jgi:hypothetical protein